MDSKGPVLKGVTKRHEQADLFIRKFILGIVSADWKGESKQETHSGVISSAEPCDRGEDGEKWLHLSGETVRY